MLLPMCANADERAAALHGTVQSDFFFPRSDKSIDAATTDKDVLFNTYADLSLVSRYIDAGIRAEFMKWPLPGYEPDFAGWGIPNVYVKGKWRNLDITAGDFYEQFGSGFILRTYEERSLGIDNSIRGLRLNAAPWRGLSLTALGGVQRHYWNWSRHSQLYGANAEMDLRELSRAVERHDVRLTLGASYVAKHEHDEQIVVPGTNSRLNLPLWVNAFDLRSNFGKGGWDFMAEFAWKGQDPSFDNHYTYGAGTAYMLTASYSEKGFGAVVNAKRSENMAFRSQRSVSGMSVFINNMPSFTYQHTYALPSIYPYATQAATGEWALEGTINYTFSRSTPLGGRYGTKISLNASYIAGLLDKGAGPVGGDVALMGTDGRKTHFFKMGACNFSDITLQMEKKLSRPLTLQLMYVHQYYNNEVLRTLETDNTPWVKADIAVAEMKYKLTRKLTLRSELQYLWSGQDQKDWAYGLLELSCSPYVMFSVSDMWNCGDTKTHYYMGAVTGNYKSNRLAVSYGRTRKGYNCTGGVCRPVPAMHGFQVVYSYYF